MYKSIIPSYQLANDHWLAKSFYNYTEYINKLILINLTESELKDKGYLIPLMYLPVSNNKYRNLINKMINYGS